MFNYRYTVLKEVNMFSTNTAFIYYHQLINKFISKNEVICIHKILELNHVNVTTNIYSTQEHSI